MPYVDSPVTEVSNDSIRTMLDLMLHQDPRMFLKACATDPVFASIGAGVLATYVVSRDINGRVLPFLTVKSYLEAIGRGGDHGLATQVGHAAAKAYRVYYGQAPDEVTETGPKDKTILVAAYHGADIRFIVDAVRELVH